MENRKYTRAGFLKLVGAGVLSIAAAKMVTLENHISYMRADGPSAGQGGYGKSVYGA